MQLAATCKNIFYRLGGLGHVGLRRAGCGNDVADQARDINVEKIERLAHLREHCRTGIGVCLRRLMRRYWRCRIDTGFAASLGSDKALDAGDHDPMTYANLEREQHAFAAVNVK